mmetsp:Transcript_40944/g.92322  ORF Transcript_40944/g.92322 Transcript_40944/m.92322 type:complete len:208 (+) Transcript_40944:74-697(+)
MSLKLATIAAALSGAAAFAPSNGLKTVARSSSALKMSVEDMPGVTGPLGFFDPAGFSNTDEATLKKFREAEIKHGRVAMLGALGFLVGDNISGWAGSGPALTQFQQADAAVPYFWVGVLFFIALIEGQTILTAWDSVKEASGKAVSDLKADYIPGDLGFDPLGLKPADEEELKVMKTKELNNGRLAMIGVAGMIAQELVSQTHLFPQ